jgi:hypothetical protein
MVELFRAAKRALNGKPDYYIAWRMWQFLYFLPLPHGHGPLRPTLRVARR